MVMDFDGTITAADCLDTVLLRHTAGWAHVLERIARFEVGRVAALREQILELRLPRARVLAEFAAEAQLRPGVGPFLRWIQQAGGRAAVISLGFLDGIEAVWEREDLPPVTLVASGLTTSARGLAIVVDDAFADCETCGPGACKATVVQRLRRSRDLVVAFGDGSADLCMARQADLTFARGRLATLCERDGLAWRPLTDFIAARAELEAWLGERRAV